MVAIVMDNANAGDSIKFPRFLNTLVCFIFACVSLFLKHKMSDKLVNVEFLSEQPKDWINKYTKNTKKRRKATKSTYKIAFFMSHFISNFVALIPVIAFAILVLAKKDNLLTNTNKWIIKEFFIAGSLVRYASWYPTMICSNFLIFRKRKRLRLITTV
ncbi:hypothetical protein MHC_00605 [Mycoplasma haemocanis str. Illinois]|uniref:Uncharacterized protein n=1 Tax=Mycoplasma haemocanis (strain Illinois) TaxID=1111676 RepID=H6N5M7_MYCHN|nr:hypothetical protein MHC_00605 [Mycoplasma haemocanis str. Illinois]